MTTLVGRAGICSFPGNVWDDDRKAEVARKLGDDGLHSAWVNHQNTHTLNGGSMLFSSFVSLVALHPRGAPRGARVRPSKPQVRLMNGAGKGCVS